MSHHRLTNESLTGYRAKIGLYLLSCRGGRERGYGWKRDDRTSKGPETRTSRREGLCPRPQEANVDVCGGRWWRGTPGGTTKPTVAQTDETLRTASRRVQQLQCRRKAPEARNCFLYAVPRSFGRLANEVLADVESAIGKGALDSVPLGDHHPSLIVAFASIRRKRMTQPVSPFLRISPGVRCGPNVGAHRNHRFDTVHTLINGGMQTGTFASDALAECGRSWVIRPALAPPA